MSTETIVLASDKLAATENNSLADLTKSSNETPESESLEETQEPSEEESSEDAEPEELEAKEKEESEGDGKKKKKGGFQKRIDKLNGKLSAKDQEIEYWREQALREQSKAKAEGNVTETVRDMGKRPSPDDFKTADEYTEALTDWKVDQKFQAREAKTHKEKVNSAVQERLSKHQARVDVFSNSHSDFEDIVESVSHIPLPMAIQETIVDSDHSPELMYELAKDPKELKRICSLSPLAAAREIGKIEARVSKLETTSSPSKEKTTTKTPKPPTPVRAKGVSAPKEFRPDMSQREYDAWRDEMSKRARP